LFVLEAKALFM